MPKSSEDDVKSAANEATQLLGAIKSQADKAFKMAGQVMKQPGNGPVIEKLVEAMEDVQADAAKLKDVIKTLSDAG